jgi:hypothetical protein
MNNRGFLTVSKLGVVNLVCLPEWPKTRIFGLFKRKDDRNNQHETGKFHMPYHPERKKT